MLIFRALKWKKSVDEVEQFSDGRPLPMTLIENKADLLPENERNNTSTLHEFSKSNNFIAGYKTSAKTGLNISESMDFLIKNIINRLSQIHNECNPDQQSLSIDPDKHLVNDSIREKPKSGCC